MSDDTDELPSNICYVILFEQSHSSLRCRSEKIHAAKTIQSIDHPTHCIHIFGRSYVLCNLGRICPQRIWQRKLYDHTYTSLIGIEKFDKIYNFILSLGMCYGIYSRFFSFVQMFKICLYILSKNFHRYADIFTKFFLKAYICSRGFVASQKNNSHIDLSIAKNLCRLLG